MDPRTPVIIGVGQVVEPPRVLADAASRPSTMSLMATALRRAIDDSRSSITSLDELIAIKSIGWATADPAQLVATACGLAVSRTRLAPMGGDSPQRLVHALSRRIQNGEVNAVALVGAESLYTASVARKAGVVLAPETQPEHVESADMSIDNRVPFSDAELANDRILPTSFYPLFENARRRRMGWSLEEQREHLGRLWELMAKVAATNPFAWIKSAPSASLISTPSPTNRMIGFPYTKLLVANLPVDMGAAVVLTSFEEARRRGVSHDAMVFPHVGAEANDHWIVSERPQLDDSVAMREIWAALRARGVESDDVAHLDLYSCFPTVVQTAAEVIGIDPCDATRPPTVTGGLTFAGGPGNNYVTHSIASMVTALRNTESGRGLVTGVGWYATKHAWGVYGSSPPRQPFEFQDVQARVDASPTCATIQSDGPVRVESYVVTHRSDGERDKLTVVARRDDGARVLSRSTDVGLMARFEEDEMIDTVGATRDGTFHAE